MAKRRVVAIVKIQLPAGKATPAPPVGTALGPHGVQTMEFCKQYNAADRGQGRPGHPGRDHHLRGPLLHLRPEDAADPGPHPPSGRPGQGLGDRRTPGRRHHHRRPGGRDRPDQNARPQRQRPRGGQVAGRRHGPLDGHQSRSLIQSRSQGITSPRPGLREGGSDAETWKEVHRRRTSVSTGTSRTGPVRPSTWPAA